MCEHDDEQILHLENVVNKLVEALEGLLDEPDKYGYGAARKALDDKNRIRAILALRLAKGE